MLIAPLPALIVEFAATDTPWPLFTASPVPRSVMLPPPDVRVAPVRSTPAIRLPRPVALTVPVEPPTMDMKPPFVVIDVPATIEIAPPLLLRFELSVVSSLLPTGKATLPPVAKMTCRCA